jgi:hypothetical protein
MIRDKLIKRAQTMCNADGKTRYVNFTSLGWRIEFEPTTQDGLSFEITPQQHA